MPDRTPIAPRKLEEYIQEINPLKAGFDLLRDHVIITDENANILYANKAAIENTGFSSEEIIGKNPGDLWGGVMPKEFYESMWNTIKVQKKPFVGEIKNKRKDGAEYWQEVHISPVLDKSGEAKFFIGIEPNITDKKQKDQFREEFISILDHQALTPATGIKWTLDWLLKGGGITEEQRKNLEDVYRQNATLLSVMNDLIFLSRMGENYPEEQTVPLENEIEKIILVLKGRYPHVKVSFEKFGDSFFTNTTKSLATEVFSTLMVNALKHSGKENGEVRVVLTKEQNQYVFSCQNNGESVPEENKADIFSPSVADKKSHKLFLVKMICNYFGWKLWFDNLPSGGAVFYVSIPYTAV